jgi:hypothetical protein
MIEYKKRKYRWEHKGRITTEIDPNKITKRLVYGDKYFGRPEKDMHGKRAFNGNLTDGAIPKLEGGWLDRKVAEWKEVYNVTKDDKLLEYMLLCNYTEGKDVYPTELTKSLVWLKYCLSYLWQYDIPTSIKLDLLFECLDDKFGHRNEDVKLAKRLEKARCKGVTREVISLRT